MKMSCWTLEIGLIGLCLKNWTRNMGIAEFEHLHHLHDEHLLALVQLVQLVDEDGFLDME